MKKSELYHLAQIAVINSPMIAPEIKPEVLKPLIDEEELAKLIESKETIEKDGE